MEPASKDRQYIEHTTISEDWSIYRLKDGTVLKTKMVVIKFIKMGPTAFQVNGVSVVGTVPANELLGPPGTRFYSPELLAESVVDPDIEFETIKEDWNSYRLKDDGIVQIKHMLMNIGRTKLFDERGEPIYQVNTQDIVKATGMTKPKSGAAVPS